MRAKIGEGGRLVIPSRYRDAMALKPGDEVVLRLEGSELRVIARDEAIRQAQALVRSYIPPGSAWSTNCLQCDEARGSVNETVLDASALVALLTDEPGAQRVRSVMGAAVISAVNLTEVALVLLEKGVPEAKVRGIIDSLAVEIAPFDEELAFAAASLRAVTKSAGWSLGDGACLALTRLRRCRVMTADRAWSRLPLGIEVDLIR